MNINRKVRTRILNRHLNGATVMLLTALVIIVTGAEALVEDQALSPSQPQQLVISHYAASASADMTASD